MINISSYDGNEFGAYMSLPESGKGPGMLILQEIFGVNKVMRDIADWYASNGYVAIVPDIFWRQEPGIELTDQTDEDWKRAFELFQGLDQPKAIEDASATTDALRKHEACTGKVGSVGFCLGGRLAYLTAVRSKPDCSVGYYGVGLESILDESANLACPLLLHIAGADEYCSPEAQQAIHGRLDGNPLVTLYDYPGQHHAFARQGGAHYNKESADLANQRTLDFFKTHLG